MLLRGAFTAVAELCRCTVNYPSAEMSLHLMVCTAIHLGLFLFVYVD